MKADLTPRVVGSQLNITSRNMKLILKMIADKERFLREIENLENALDRKLNSKKLVETRCEERLYRVGTELCLDITTKALHNEHFQLDNTTRNLTDRLNQSKYSVYCAILE